jgi:hypothetical protein
LFFSGDLHGFTDSGRREDTNRGQFLAGNYRDRASGDVIEVYQLANIRTPQSTQAILTALRTVSQMQKIFGAYAPRLLAFRGTSGAVAQADWLTRQLDIAPAANPARKPAYKTPSGDAMQVFYLANLFAGKDLIDTVAAVRRLLTRGTFRALVTGNSAHHRVQSGRKGFKHSVADEVREDLLIDSSQGGVITGQSFETTLLGVDGGIAKFAKDAPHIISGFVLRNALPDQPGNDVIGKGEKGGGRSCRRAQSVELVLTFDFNGGAEGREETRHDRVRWINRGRTPPFGHRGKRHRAGDFRGRVDQVGYAPQ